MGTISSIANLVNGCAGGTVSTGKLGCNVQFGEPRHLIGLKAGLEILATETFDQAFINGLIQAGNAVPLIGASSFEDMSSEDSVFTYSSGVELQNLEGLPKYKLTFDEGHQFYKEMSKLKGFKNLDFIIGDNEGNWKLVKKSNGNYKGFSAGQVLPMMVKNKVSGGDIESKAITVQLTNRLEYDTNYDILLRSNLDNDPEDFNGVNAVSLAFSVVPSNLDTSLVISTLLDADRKTVVEGMIVSDFLVTVDGATITPSLLTEVNGVYTLTIAALATAEVLTVQLYDSSANKDVIISASGDLFRSNTLNATVIV